MTADEVDGYLAGLEEPMRSTLAALRRSIRAVVPDADEGISYGMPAFRVDGAVVAGFAAFKNHLVYLPHSGQVFARLGDRLDGYEHTRGSLHFPIDEPLPTTWCAGSWTRSSRSSGTERGRSLHGSSSEDRRVCVRRSVTT